MSGLKESLKNQAYLFGSVSIFLFFAAWGIWWSFFQIWLTSPDVGLELDGSSVGTIFSINSAISLVLMFVYGMVQDKLDLKRNLTITIAAVMTLTGPFVNYVYRPMLESQFMVAAILGGIVLSAGFIGSAGLFEAFVERLSRRNNFEFGQARMWGSVGYAIVALCAGFIFTINPAINFWLGSALGLVLLLILLFWHPEGATETRPGQEEPTTPSFSEMASQLGNAKLWVVIVFVLLTWTFYTVFDQQMFPDFYVSLYSTGEAGQKAYGMLNSFQVFLEAIMMGVVPLIMRRVGVRNTLLMGVVVMCLRIGMCGIFDGPILISCAKMLHSLEVPLFMLAIFRYITLHFNPSMSATLYLVGFGISSQLGTVAMSAPLGHLRDNIGYQPTFLVISGTVAVAAIFAVIALKRDDQDVEGDPFIPGSVPSA